MGSDPRQGKGCGPLGRTMHGTPGGSSMINQVRDIAVSSEQWTTITKEEPGDLALTWGNAGNVLVRAGRREASIPLNFGDWWDGISH